MRHLLVYDRSVTYGSTAAFVWQLTRFWFFALIYSTVFEVHVRVDSADRLEAPHEIDTQAQDLKL